MKIIDVINEIEKHCPRELAIEHDAIRIGLQLGDSNFECTGIVTCLDVTDAILEKAISEKCNLVLSHHPFIYYPIQKLDFAFGHNRLIAKAIMNGIAIYSAHTNMDKAEEGINRKLIELFDGQYEQSSLEEECIFVAKVKDISLKELAKKISNKLEDKSVKVVGDLSKRISKIAICSGGGGNVDDIELARSCGADVYISGDFAHHSYMYAKENNFALIEYSHFNSEIIVEKLFNEILRKLNIKTISGNDDCPYMLVEEL